MPRCPVCQTRYVAAKTERCPVCGWDVQPLSLVTGLIPEVSQKEAVRLEWAKQLWSKAKLHQDQVRPLQMQIQDLHDREQLLQARLEKADQAAINLAETVRQHEATIAHLQTKLLEPDELDPLEPEPIAQIVEVPKIEESELEEIYLQSVTVPKAKSAVEVLDRAEPIPKRIADRSLHPFTVEVVILQPDGRRIEQHTAAAMKEFLADEISLEMVYIPAGQFLMGSPETEAGRDRHESPQHLVTIAPFLMSRFLITQAQWREIAALPKVHRSLNLYPADFEGEARPVEQVSWYDATEFCARLAQTTGQPYRLPSEAEWEYACRAGTTTPFHFGDTIAPDLANYDGLYTYSFGTAGIYRQETTPVGTFEIANAFGLSDMHGNVWEWCADAWHETYDGAPIDSRVWEVEDNVSYRVLRGGAWYCLPELCRSAQRHWNQPDMAGSGIGFRVACSIG